MIFSIPVIKTGMHNEAMKNLLVFGEGRKFYEKDSDRR